MERVGRGGSVVRRCLLTLLLPLHLCTPVLLSKAMVSAVFGEIGVAVPRVVVVREQHGGPPVDLDQRAAEHDTPRVAKKGAQLVRLPTWFDSNN